MNEQLEIATQAALIALGRFAEMRPRPSQVTQRQAAEMLGRGKNTINRMVAAGTLRLNRCGMIPISEIDRVLAADRA